jgi:hypothetical protein
VPGAALALLVLAGCTGEGTASAPDEVRAVETVPDQVPDGTVAVSDPPRPDVIDVVLSFADWNDSARAVEAAGYVSPVVESGGTCTIELRLDGRDVVARAPGEPDATTTVCGDLRVPRDALTPGVWTAVLRYESPAAAGVSPPITVEVPR